jgi:glutathione S-transferase
MGHTTDEAVVKEGIEVDCPKLFDYLEGQITGEFIVGNQLTIGDLGLASPFVNLGYAGVTVDKAKWPKLAKYLDGILGRPSFANCIAEEKQQFGF